MLIAFLYSPLLSNGHCHNISGLATLSHASNDIPHYDGSSYIGKRTSVGKSIYDKPNFVSRMNCFVMVTAIIVSYSGAAVSEGMLWEQNI